MNGITERQTRRIPMPRPSLLVARDRLAAPHTQVLQELRGAGPSSRPELSRAISLSPATVGRAVTALLEVGLLTERPDLAATGITGRPGIPVEIDTSHYVVVAVHHGLAQSTVAVCDLLGQVLASETKAHALATPGCEEDSFDAAEVASRAAALLRDLNHRTPLSAGLVAPWRDLGLDAGRCADALSEQLGLLVETADHVAAIAAAEFIHRRHGDAEVTTYLYARNSAGFVTAVDRGGRTEISRLSSLTHFPTGSNAHCPCGMTGCLAATASEQAVAERAHRLGIIATPRTEALQSAAFTGNAAALELLADRARVLGEVAAVVRDMVDPDRLILVGQAFTGHPAALPQVLEAFAARTQLPPLVPTFTRFGADVQAVAAGTAALAPVYENPLATLGDEPARSWRCQGSMNPTA